MLNFVKILFTLRPLILSDPYFTFNNPQFRKHPHRHPHRLEHQLHLHHLMNLMVAPHLLHLEENYNMDFSIMNIDILIKSTLTVAGNDQIQLGSIK